jgi:polar amino acid transport system permease protein
MNIQSMIAQLGQGMLTSVIIYALTLIGAVPLALPLALARGGKNKIVKLVAGAYTSFMRGTPLMLQLIAVYFGPWYLFKIRISDGYRFYAVIIAFVLNYAAYFAEIYRAGIAAVPNGQREAASVLGYTNTQTFFRIVLPQVIKHILPPMTNEFITLIKDTSLAFSIGVMEMFTLAKQISSADRSMVPLLAAAAFYYIFNVIVAFVMGRVEKKLDYYR